MKKILKTILPIVTIGIMSKLNAQESTDTYFETRNYCKFIKNRSYLVINYRDTLPIYSIDTIHDDTQHKIVCDIGQNKKLVFNPYYYKNMPWVQPIDATDLTVKELLTRDAMLIIWYYYYEKHALENRRDSIEQELLKNRAALVKYAHTHQK